MESIPECLTDEETLENENSASTEFKAKKIITDESSSKHFVCNNSARFLSVTDTGATHELTAISNTEIKSTLLENDSILNKRLSVSLIDLSEHKQSRNDKNFLRIDKELHFTNASSDTNVKRISRSYCNFETCGGKKSDSPINSSSSPNYHNNTAALQPKLLSPCSKLLFSPSESCLRTEFITPSPTTSRQRSGSVQWIQNAFHNVERKCKGLLDLRRPSDIAEGHMCGSNENIEMEISEDESSKFTSNSSANGRRFSENIFGKKRLLGLGHLRDLWKERNQKKNETKDNDQTRPDVCPLFNFPKNIEEDEKILDSLRQATRKCTAMDPSTRPTSCSVLEQLSQLIND